MLGLGVAAAATGCARRMSPAAPSVAVPRTPLYVAAQMQVPLGGGDPAALYRRAQGYARWFAPVAAAFSAAHPRTPAVVVPELLPPQGGALVSDPRVSVSVGGPPGGADLAPYLRDANVDPGVLLPGILAAATWANGQIAGVPVDFGVELLAGDPQRLRAVGLQAPPAAGWTVAQLQGAVSVLAQHGALFGPQLGLASYRAQAGSAWVGFALGYGGSPFGVGRLTLTQPKVLEGLTAYADLLRVTWGRTLPRLPPSLQFEVFSGVDAQQADPHGAAWLARFPRTPVAPVVPAQVLCATVKPPQLATGAEFAVWLVSEQGQHSLTAIGFPAVRVGVADRRSWLRAEKFRVSPANLRFPPGTFTSPEVQGFFLTPRITSALAQPPATRLGLLRSIEAALNAYLAGSLTAPQATRQMGPIAGPCDATTKDGRCLV